MPALRVGDGRVIAQSTAILEYLEETHPHPPLLPAEPVLRAQARAFAQLITSDLHPINNNRVRKYLGTRLGADEGGGARLVPALGRSRPDRTGDDARRA
jgi:glutathione S-transferase